jgi:hypothetical protein
MNESSWKKKLPNDSPKQTALLTNDPTPPAAPPHSKHRTVTSAHSSLHFVFSTIKLPASVKPIMTPPPKLAIVPTTLIAPFVPGGTVSSVVINLGSEFDKIPSSEASVSPRQQAKCLKK